MIKRVVFFLIRGYQKTISPLFGSKCRFVPTCSDYCLEAIDTCGIVKGLVKTGIRICKCHPFHPGGFDPVINKD